MLLTGSPRLKCLTGAQTLHCFAQLKNDVAEALPYLPAANLQVAAGFA